LIIKTQDATKPLRLLPAPLAAALLVFLWLLPFLLLPRLNLDNAPEVYFPPDAPAVQFERELRERFPEDQVLVALFEGGALFEPDWLQRQHELVLRMQAEPLVERVLSVTTVDRIAGDAEGFIVEPLVDPARLTERDAQGWRARVLADRFAPGLLAARDGTALAVVVRPHPMEDSRQRLQLEQALRASAAELGLAGELAAVAGHVALDAAELTSMLRDSALFIPLTLVLGLALLWWLFRRGLALLVAALTVGVVVNVTVALIVLADRPYTLVSAMTPPLMTALTIALLIHFFNALRHAAQRGHQGGERVVRALEEIRRPARYTALTTAAGLASLSLSPIRPIEAFGLTAAAGVLVLYLVAMHLVPPLFARWDRAAWPGGGAGGRSLDAAVGRLARIGIRRAGWVVLAVGLLTATAVPLVWRVQVETDLYRFFAAEHPITQATALVEERLAGVATLEVVLDAPERDGLLEPQRLAAVQALRDWAEALPQVDRALSMADIIEEMNWAFHEENPAERRLPDSRPLIAQYLFIYDGRDLYDFVDREFARSRVLLNLNVHGARAIREAIDEIRHRLEAEPPADLDWTIAGQGRLFADQETLLIRGQVRSLIAALGLIFLLMLVQWRSFGAAALCMVPNASPILFIFASMGVFGIWLDFATAMIASVAVGVAVDDTVHVYHGYRSRRRAGASPCSALVRTYRQAGRAVTATTLILVVQFSVLAASQFQPTVAFGLLTALGLTVALGFDLLLLPALLILLTRRPAQRIARVSRS
jgi:uncharacterized protein